MNIKQLSYFNTVAEHQSISHAAIQLGIAQSALSRHIGQLETSLGIRLLHRHGRGVSLTTAGEKLLRHSQAALKQLEQAQQEIQALKETPEDSTVIAFPPTVAQLLAVPLALKFQQQFSHSRLRIEEAYSGLVLEWLAAGKVDVAVVYRGPNSMSILGDELMEEQLYLVGPASCGLNQAANVNADQLGTLPLVLPNHPHGLRLLLEQKSRQGKFTLNVAMEINGLEATKALVQSTNMYTVLPYAAVHKEVVGGLLAASKIVKPGISRSLIIASSTRHPLSATSRAVVKMIRELVTDLSLAGHWLHAPL